MSVGYYPIKHKHKTDKHIYIFYSQFLPDSKYFELSITSKICDPGPKKTAIRVNFSEIEIYG